MTDLEVKVNFGQVAFVKETEGQPAQTTTEGSVTTHHAEVLPVPASFEVTFLINASGPQDQHNVLHWTVKLPQAAPNPASRPYADIEAEAFAALTDQVGALAQRLREQLAAQQSAGPSGGK